MTERPSTESVSRETVERRLDYEGIQCDCLDRWRCFRHLVLDMHAELVALRDAQIDGSGVIS